MERSRRTFLLWSGAAMLGGAAVVAGARLLDGGDDAALGPPPRPLPAPDRVLPGGAVEVGATGLAVAGISPLITPTAEFFRIDEAAGIPSVDTATWRLSVRGRVQQPFEVTYDDLLALPQTSVPITLSCVSNRVGGSLVGTAVWQGVELATLLDRAGVDPAGTQIVGRSVDGFTAGFPTEVVRDGRPALVAVGMNGEPLPRQHGFPARLIVAGLFGYVSATKWLSSIELTGWDEFDGYWITRGWAKDAPVISSSRIDVPFDEARIPSGPMTLAGVAWAPMAGVAAVEVRMDGEPWRRAELGEDIGNGAWRQWRWDWDATPGTHTVSVRTIDRDGRVQDATRRPPLPAGATGLVEQTIIVR